MSYRVCIPTAGTGSRLGGLTSYLNKSLVGIANRPTLCHLVEQFPAETEFVIALGHKGQLVREFVELAYPGRRFFFANVAPFEGPGSGLGLSLMACKEYLQQPFVFTSCDTLVEENVPAPDHDWLGYAEVEDPRPYRTLVVANGRVVEVKEKDPSSATPGLAYIGLAGVHDVRGFWKAMEGGGEAAVETGEAFGLRELLTNQPLAKRFTWHDTGNLPALEKTREVYRVSNGPTILEKGNEAIWFVEGQVIKFSDDKKFIANRVQRVEQLQDFVPEVTGSQTHMYRYRMVSGEVLSEVVTLPLFERLLKHCSDFWRPTELDSVTQQAFKTSCRKFYRDKTLERIALFYSSFGRQDDDQPINGVAMPTLAKLLDRVDWDILSDGRPGRFHGDFHFENILWSDDTRRFTFLDWRQDFAGDIAVGDIYYDLAKLLHGLIVNHRLIAENHFSVQWHDDAISFDLHRRQVLVECELRFGEWLCSHGYDLHKVRTLTALIYLNIAALHHHPYSLLLYALGKSMLHSLHEDPR